MDFRRRSPALFRGGAVMRDKAPRRRALHRQGQTEIARYMRQFALKSGPGAGRGAAANLKTTKATRSRKSDPRSWRLWRWLSRSCPWLMTEHGVWFDPRHGFPRYLIN